MTVKEIVKEYLVTHGYEGLTNGRCACGLEELMECVNDVGECVAGHKILCPGIEECDCGGDRNKLHICEGKKGEV